MLIIIAVQLFNLLLLLVRQGQTAQTQGLRRDMPSLDFNVLFA
jgi:hypothetical protein